MSYQWRKFSHFAIASKLPSLLCLALYLEAAIQDFTTAQPWDPSLPRCDPVARANELAKAAKAPSQP